MSSIKVVKGLFRLWVVLAVCWIVPMTASITSAVAGGSDFPSASEGLRQCRYFMSYNISIPNNTVAENVGSCMGAMEVIFYYNKSKYICEPKSFNFHTDLNINNMVKVVVGYIQSRPTRLEENFYSVALDALSEAWPCKR